MLRFPVLVLSHLTDPRLIGAVYVLSEIFLALTKRSRAPGPSRDRGSLLALWITISLAIFFAQFALTVRGARLPHPGLWAVAGLIIFISGIALRWWAILHLGRYFTVDVTISPEQEVVETGPYRLIRHPSYTGSLIAFIGFGLTMRNWLALVIMLVPITIAFLWRIHVEEKALMDGLGEPYRHYMAHTKRLIPFVY